MTTEAAALEPAANLEAVVAAVAARCLQTPGSIAPDVPFSQLGLDSLRTLELAADLEDTIGRPLPEDLLEGCPDIRSLAARLHRICSGEPEAVFDAHGQMFADAVLPDDVRPAQRAASQSTSLADARTVLLTGATGFLGAALAREILERTEAALICLARPAVDASASIRVRRQLSAAAIPDQAIATRVRTIEADLSSDRLGLDDRTFAALSDQMAAPAAICHAGASVNWVASYAGLRSTNVAATLELLRLACRAGASFHFVSSLSVCYSTSAAHEVDERFDPLRHARGVHLGYAQSKLVAEALVRQAAGRGLPARIYRPSLISGDSRTGAFNRDDLLATLIRGCVHMRAVPDLDWALDALPVETVARAIVDLSGARGPVFHLAHPRPRHWRECVLWMRLYGYDLRLIPYAEWLRQLELATDDSRRDAAVHPLRPLRDFFRRRPPEEHGLTLPELYEEGRRPHAVQRRTAHALSRASWTCPVLDAALLDTYFAEFVRSGGLPGPARASRRNRSTTPIHFDEQGFSRITGLDVRRVHPLGAGSDHSIIGELAAWQSRRPTGLFRFRLEVQAAIGSLTREVVVKLKPRDTAVIETGEALAAVCDPALGALYTKWRDRLGLSGSHERELAIYRQRDPRFVEHAPAVLGTLSDAERETWLVVLERITDGALMNEADRPGRWTNAALSAAIDGLAKLHALWYARERELAAMAWIGHVPTTRSMSEMAELWEALADHAAPSFAAWGGADLPALHLGLARAVTEWWPALDAAPRTLIHNDFNPRNICLRGPAGARRLCAYDWELATIGAPQRDLAELLCFVLPEDVERSAAQVWIDRHRVRLEREAGRPIDRQVWQAGFRAALCDLLVTRLATYALINRVRTQSFLPRVVRTWRRLYHLFPREEES